MVLTFTSVQIMPPADADVFMVAPKGPGHLVRRLLDGGGVPCLKAVYQSTSGPDGNRYPLLMHGVLAELGMRRAYNNLQEETETDLFGEQAVLSAVRRLVKAGFETLSRSGYQP